MPKVGIVICNHNYGEYIESCIKSALNQTHRDIICLVIDDASTDDSVEKINGFKDSRLQTIPLEKCVGASEARNIGIRSILNEVDYVLILDADDEAKPNKVEELLKRAVQHPRIGVVYADYDILDVETGNILAEFKEPYNMEKLYKNCIVHSGSLISKAALIETVEIDETGNNSFYDKRLHGPVTETFIGCCEDYDLWIRISEKFFMVHVPKSLSLVRAHSKNQSKMENVATSWDENHKLMNQKIRARKNVSKS